MATQTINVGNSEYIINIKSNLNPVVNVTDANNKFTLTYDFTITYNDTLNLYRDNVGLHITSDTNYSAGKYYDYNYSMYGFPQYILVEASDHGEKILNEILDQYKIYDEANHDSTTRKEFADKIAAKYKARSKYAEDNDLTTWKHLLTLYERWKNITDSGIQTYLENKMNHIMSLSLILNVKVPNISSKGILNDRCGKKRLLNNKKHGVRQYKHNTAISLLNFAIYINLFDSYTYNKIEYRIIDQILTPVKLAENRYSNNLFITDVAKLWHSDTFGNVLKNLGDPNNLYQYYYRRFLNVPTYGKTVTKYTWTSLFNYFKLALMLKIDKKNLYHFRNRYCKYIQYKFLMGYFDIRTPKSGSPEKASAYINTHNFKCKSSYQLFYFCNYMTIKFSNKNLNNTTVAEGKEKHTVYVQNHVDSFRDKYCVKHTDGEYYLKDQYKEGAILLDLADASDITDNDILLYKPLLRPLPNRSFSYYAIYVRDDVFIPDYELKYCIINGMAMKNMLTSMGKISALPTSPVDGGIYQVTKDIPNVPISSDLKTTTAVAGSIIIYVYYASGGSYWVYLAPLS